VYWQGKLNLQQLIVLYGCELDPSHHFKNVDWDVWEQDAEEISGPKRATGSWREVHNEDSVIFTPHLVLLGLANQSECECCSTQGRWEISATFCLTAWKEEIARMTRRGGMIIWKLIILKRSWSFQTGYKWIKIGVVGGHLDHVNDLSGSIKGEEFLNYQNLLLASKEIFCSMDLFICQLVI
jgi:hypothetical protein